uniref:C-type lectin domain family 2 member D n=1 Tax=Rhinolophus ferrumequinum TaxID=59479 RepID=A0A671E9Z8_RHIFE
YLYFVGKNLQRKFVEFISPITAAKVICCLIIIAVLVVSVIVLSVFLGVRLSVPVLECPAQKDGLFAACPERWIGLGKKCFYFSEDIRNWTYSQAFCASLKANLARIETLEELVRNVFGSWSLLNT